DSNNSTNVSKVRKNIREFERRSSICGDTTVPPVVPALQHKKDPTVTSANIHSNTNDSNSNSMRMSKSCFEVDCCDNSSSGVSSDVDGEYGTRTETTKAQQMSQNSQQINRRNSQIGEKIAVLMAATAQTSQAAAMAAAAAAAPPPGAPPMMTTTAGAHTTRRTASYSDDSHKTRPKGVPNTSTSQSMMA
ncbi:unnamed protein product, partial [Oppiella nova]